MPCRATHDGQVILKCLDKMWTTGGGDGSPFQDSLLKNLINSMKRQKDMTQDHEPLRPKMSNMLLGKSGGQLTIAPERIRWLG